MKWWKFLSARLVRLFFVLVALTAITFLMVHMAPGDPAQRIAGLNADNTTVEETRQRLGLDQPLLQQFGTYVSHLLRGDLGDSFMSREPVAKKIGRDLGPTMELALIGLALIALIGVPIGLVGAALTQRGGAVAEMVFSSLTAMIAAVPQYLAATFLAFLFAVTWQIFPVAGAGSLLAAVLPAVAISIRPAAAVARLVRVRTLAVLASPYARAARSKRLPTWKFYGKHILPNSVTTVLATGGMVFASLIGGAVVVEAVFARPGLGTTLVDAVLVGDYPLIQGIVLLLGVSVVVVNTLMDLIIGLIDPQTMETNR